MKKDMQNAVLAGVCSGMAKEFGLSAPLIRLLFVLATFFGFGTPVLIYIIMALILPKEV